MIQSRLHLSALSVVFSSALSGCFAASISTHIAEPIRPRQSEDVAVLAVMPGVVQSGSEWMRPQAMESLVRGLAQRFPGIQIVDPETAAARLAAQSMADEYASLLGDFERAGVVDPDRLEQLLDVIDATHFLHIRAEYSVQGQQRVTQNLDGSPLYYSTKHQTVSVVARLWESGASPSWEAVIRSESQRGPFTRHRAPAEMIESLVSSVVERVPLSGAVTASVAGN